MPSAGTIIVDTSYLRRAGGKTLAPVSVMIPTLNEASNLPRCL